MALLLHVGGAAWAQEAARPRYTLKEEEPLTGSNLKRDVVTGSAIPIDKRYAELSAEEQAYLKSHYEQMGPGDEPPFPLHGLRPIYRAIVTAQRKLLVQGTVSMFVEVDSRGQPVSVAVYQSPDPQMTRAVANILMLQSFKPAICDGQPCSMGYPFRMTFTTRL